MKRHANAIIRISGKRTAQPRPPVECWANSSFDIFFMLDFAVSALTLKVLDVATGEYMEPIRGTLNPRQGGWYFHAPRRYTQHGGRSRYKLTATDVEGGRTVLGEGELRVCTGFVEDPADAAGSDDAKDNGYILIDGAWYNVKVSEDAAGVPMFAVGDIAPALVPSGVSGEAYAYNKSTGKFHKVIVGTDDAGKLMLQCADEGEDADGATFAYDSQTKFYYRMECAVDEAGATMLQVGDRQR